MSILEKLRTIQSDLSNIRIPAAFTESITIPMFNVILALDQVCKELENSKTEFTEKENAKIEVVEKNEASGG